MQVVKGEGVWSPLWHRAVCVSQFPVLFPPWAVLRGPLVPEAGLRLHEGLFAKPQTKPCIKTNPPYGGSLLKEMGKNSFHWMFVLMQSERKTDHVEWLFSVPWGKMSISEALPQKPGKGRGFLTPCWQDYFNSWPYIKTGVVLIISITSQVLITVIVLDEYNFNLCIIFLYIFIE